MPIAGMMVTGDSGVRVVGLYGGRLIGRTLSRAVLDSALLGAAADAGVDIEEGVLVRGTGAGRCARHGCDRRRRGAAVPAD